MSDLNRAEAPEPGSFITTDAAEPEEPPIEGQTPSSPASAPQPASPVRARRTASKKPDPVNRAIVSERSRAFLRTHYPGISIHDWNDWKWQVRNRVRRLDMLEKMMTLTADERASVEKRTGNLPIAITPYYLSLLSPTDPEQPLRKTHIPVSGE